MNDFHVYARKGRMALLGFGALMFVCIGILFIFLAPEAAGFDIKKIFDRSPMLTISEEGIRDQASHAAAGLIRWEDIADIQALRMYNQDFLCIFTHDRNLIMNRYSGFQFAAQNEQGT